jgi:hypothetical protein
LGLALAASGWSVGRNPVRKQQGVQIRGMVRARALKVNAKLERFGKTIAFTTIEDARILSNNELVASFTKAAFCYQIPTLDQQV